MDKPIYTGPAEEFYSPEGFEEFLDDMAAENAFTWQTRQNTYSQEVIYSGVFNTEEIALRYHLNLKSGGDTRIRLSGKDEEQLSKIEEKILSASKFF